jgi:hypothetical protein
LCSHRDFGPEIAVRYAALSGSARTRVLDDMRALLVRVPEPTAAGPGPGFGTSSARPQTAPAVRRFAAIALRRLGGNDAAAILYDALVGPPTPQVAVDPSVAPMRMRGRDRDMREMSPEERAGRQANVFVRSTTGPDEGALGVARALGGLGRGDLLQSALNARGRTLFDEDSVAVQMAALTGMAFVPSQTEAVAMLSQLLALATTPELRWAVGSALMTALQRTASN